MRESVFALAAVLLLSDALAAPEEVSFAAADGVTLYGDMYRSAEGDSASVILLFHQAGSDARGEYSGIAARLQDHGYNILAIDQRSGGTRFGGVNRTVEGLERKDIGYCEAYPDLVAALNFAREQGFDGRLAVWGSSYSAALVFQLAATHSDEVDAVLGFSPASGAPMADCSATPYLPQITMPALALRPQREYEIESVQNQMAQFESLGIQTYVADPGVHGSSMLNADRVGASTEEAWGVVLAFLKAHLQAD
jgi:dienelactone hydrolase